MVLVIRNLFFVSYELRIGAYLKADREHFVKCHYVFHDFFLIKKFFIQLLALRYNLN